MNILLVEDEPGIREVITAMLHQGGHHVEVVCNGDDAIRAYRNRSCDYDLVLTDRSHPGMDGIELAAEIRRINPSQNIAFQTAASTDSVTEQHIATNAVGDIPHIKKPYGSEQLLRFIVSAGKPHQ